ncbi:MAG: DUF5715 family protein [Longimicrobiales bacterium]
MMSAAMRLTAVVFTAVLAASAIGCGRDAPGNGPDAAGADRTGTAGAPAIERADLAVFTRAVAQAVALGDSVEQLLLPTPLLTPAQEAALRRSSNAQQLARARALGVRVQDSTVLQRLLSDGRLVVLPDTTPLWVLRDLTHSLPYVTPATRALLDRIAGDFQAQLEERGLPPFRLEVTSVLRTPEAQAELRESNVNAAAGTSTHEYGTTLDLGYDGYTAPAELSSIELPADSGLAALARRAAALALERAAARKSRELQMILGTVLREMQDEGLLLVTLERQQPVYHLTLARAATGAR